MTYHPELGHDTSTGPVSVFVLAEDALAAEGLRSALASDARIALAERAEDAAVVLWDFGASADRASLAAVSSARARKQAIVALVPDEQAAATALHQGALGVLARRIHAPTLTAAIMAVRFGLCVLDVEFADHYLQLPAAGGLDEVDALTAREREVLELLALGLSNKAIAERLDVSVHTVKFHVNSILAKLGADSRTAAVARALRRGWVST